jgi:thiol-disulfide isomerase/thioredoxin
MISRRYFLAAVGAAVAVSSGAVRAANEQSFTAQAFRAAQDAGKPILVDIQASWCPTCRAQTKILNELTALPQFKDLVVLRVDFDSQKQAVRDFGARWQSTLIVFKGPNEVGRSVGDTDPSTIAALLAKAI